VSRRTRARGSWATVAIGALLAIGFVVGYAFVFGGGDDDDDDLDFADLIPPACRAGPTTPGIDVSYYQNTIRWRRVRKAGVVFAFIRVSDGTSTIDPAFRRNWSHARPTGILRGAYQYFRPDQDAREQADVLIRAIRRDPGELPPVIDVETTGGKSRRQIVRGIRTWIARVRVELGVEPIVYTGPDFWIELGAPDATSQALWLAHYIDACPLVPPRWRAWTFWQHSDRGRVPGITGPVDLDVFAGTFTELQDFARRSRRPL